MKKRFILAALLSGIVTFALTRKKKVSAAPQPVKSGHHLTKVFSKAKKQSTH